jgi:hypothetical protein
LNAYETKVWKSSGSTLYMKAPPEVGLGSILEVWEIPGTGCWGIRLKFKGPPPIPKGPPSELAEKIRKELMKQ